jgi:Uma2 family endonuclease
MTSATAAETKLLTADELLRLDAKGVRGELIRGVLCETMPAGLEHGTIVMNLGAELKNFIKPRKLGRLVGSDSGVWLERDPDTVREPDVAYFSTERIPPGVRVTGYAETTPDLVVEVVSPSNTIREVNDKAFMWLGHGVRLVWLVYPDTRTVDVYQGGRAVTTLTEDDSLDGLDVLPGFACAVSEIFDD